MKPWLDFRADIVKWPLARSRGIHAGKTDTTALVWMAVAMVLGGIAVWACIRQTGVTLPAGVTVNDYDRVAQTLHRSRQQAPDRDEVLFKLGVEHATRHKWDTAAALFTCVSPLDTRFGREARYLKAQSVLQQDHLRESERLFREYLAAAPVAGTPAWKSPPDHDDQIQAFHYLSYLLSVELRFDERRQLLSELVHRGDADLFDTLACHFQSLMEWNNSRDAQRLERACSVSPDDWTLQAVLAQYWIAQGRLDQAWKLLQMCRERLPNDLTIASACLTCLEERGDRDGYLQLAAELPPMRDADPVHLLRHRGRIALQRERIPEAVTCFQRALTLDPAHVACRLGLAEAWLALDQPVRRKQELAAAQDLARIQNRLGWAASTTPDPEVLVEIARLSASAGLRTAAEDICRISIRLFDDHSSFEQFMREVSLNSSVESSQ